VREGVRDADATLLPPSNSWRASFSRSARMNRAEESPFSAKSSWV
jgi:hypothetical protein